MATNPRYRNGARRRALRARHLRSGVTCAWPWCPWPGEPFDLTLHYLDDRSAVIDEIVPVACGGDPLSWENTRPLHRWCNQQRGDGRHDDGVPVTVVASPGW